MRTFDTDVQAELERDNPDVFHGVEIATGSETLRVVKRGRGASFGGNDYHEAMETVTPVASQASVSDKQLDVQQVDVEVSNMPGAIPPGTRVSRRLPVTVEGETSRLHLYAYTQHNSDGSKVPASLKRETLFVGTPHLDQTGWVLDLAKLRMEPLFEKYLDAPICTEIAKPAYKLAREADIGKAIPSVFGTAKNIRGRVTKAYGAGVPVPGSNNSGSGAIARPTHNGGGITQTYTVTISNPETVEHTGPGDTDTNFGDTVSPRVCGAQSFQLTGAQALTSIDLPMKCLVAPGAGTSFTAVVYLYDDNSGKPGNYISHANVTIDVNMTTYADRRATFTTPVSLSGSTTYWIVVRAWGAFSGGIVSWHQDATGGYAGGTARNGTYPTSDDFVTKPAFTWTNSSRDFLFSLIFGDATGFSVSGSVSGSQGSGTVGTDFTTSNGAITIPGGAWSGNPAGGDTFTFEGDGGGVEVVFADSPLATPCLAPANWKWNGERPTELFPISQSTDNAGDALVNDELTRAQSFTVDELMLVDSISCKPWRSASASEPLIYELQKAADHLPTGEVLVTIEVPASAVTTSSAGSNVTQKLPVPLLLQPGQYAIVLRTTAVAGSAYALRYSNSSSYADGRMSTIENAAAESIWTLSGASLDLVFSASPLSFAPSASATDKGGNRVAKIVFGGRAEIPDDVEITADIAGYHDDSSGTYTDTPASLITIPADVMHFLAAKAGLPSGNIDVAGTFIQSRASAGSVQRFNGAFDTANQPTLNGMLDWAFQSHSQLGWSDEGKLTFRHLSLDPPSLVTLGWGDVVDENASSEGPRRFAVNGYRTRVEQWLINKITLRYDRDWSQSKGAAAYRGTLANEDATSIAAYGEHSKDELFLCDAIATEAMAQDTFDYWLATRKDQKEEIEVIHPLSQAQLEEGDVVQFDLQDE